MAKVRIVPHRVATLLARLAIDVVARGGEDPLPGPLTAGGGELLGERAGKLDPTGVLRKVALVPRPHVLEMWNS